MAATTKEAVATAVATEVPTAVKADAGASGYPAPLSHLLMVVMWISPYFVEVPANWSVVLHACLAVYVGCWRSVKATPPKAADSMTTHDAMRFPIMGSLVLFSLFLVFKFFPKDLVNMVLTGYFGILGTIALTAAVLPFVEPSMPESIRSKGYNKKIKIPFVSEPIELEATLPELLVGLPALGFCVWYCLTRHWLANNALGLAFAIEGVEHLALGSVLNGVILLCGLFVYDVFWVFCTPVMVSVAKSFDAPIKLLFPRGLADGGKMQFSMLGLGDIVIPGIFVALMLRYDVQAGATRGGRYFATVYGGYTFGLASTIVVMNVFKAAQPALLYIVPALLISAFGLAVLRREVAELFAWKEIEEEEEKEAVKASEADKASAAAAEPEKKKDK